jgi:ribosomal protein L40E
MMNEEEAPDDFGISAETKESIVRLNSLKPISELLNFSAERELQFTPEREWDFSLDRDLNFDMERDLWFDPDRDLPFGERAVIFRGYLCPQCRRWVARASTTCSLCGATYKSPIRFGSKEGEGTSQAQARVSTEGSTFRGTPPPPTEGPVEVKQFRKCLICEMRNPMDAVYCVECGNKIVTKKVVKRQKQGGS